MKKILTLKNAVSFTLAFALLLSGTNHTGAVADSSAVTLIAEAADKDAAFTAPDLSDYIHWDGKSEFKENTKYHISSEMKIAKNGDFTLPASSTLYIAENGALNVYQGGNLTINGALIIAPKGSLTTSGRLITNTGSTAENYGTFAATPSATNDISAVFTSHSGAAAAFGGFTNIYKNGKILSYGDMAVPRSSAMTVTGIVRSYEGSQLSISGKIETTLNGRISIAGACVLSGILLTSGSLAIEKTADFRRETGAIFGAYDTGRHYDYREEQTAPIEYSMTNGMKGIDVSSWQGVIDWEKVAKSGVKFAIIRSSYSTDKVDKMFHYNIQAAKKAGLYVGVYHYCYAWTDEEARQEAQFFMETVAPYEIDLPLMFDFEDPSQEKLGKYQLTRMANIFMKELKNGGYYPMLYSYKNWLNENLMMEYLTEFDVAVAEWYVTEPTYQGEYSIWQYSATGLVSGIEGDVDLDICYKDYPTIIREGGWNHLSKT